MYHIKLVPHNFCKHVNTPYQLPVISLPALESPLSWGAGKNVFHYVIQFSVLQLYICVQLVFKTSSINLTYIYRVSQEECARLREGVPYVKVYLYNPKHLCPKLNGYGDNGQRKVWLSCGSTHCTRQLSILSISVLECGIICQEFTCCFVSGW